MSSASNEAQLAAIVMSSEDAIVSYGLDGTIMTWNPGARKLYGYSADEAIGQSLTLLETAGKRGEMYEIIMRIAAGESARTFETRRRRKDGKEVHVALTVSPIRDREGVLVGISGISRDVSARVAAETAKTRAEQQLRAVTDAVIDAIIASDSSGRITAWNRGAEKMFGYSVDEVMGMEMGFLMPDHLRERHRVAMAKVAGGAPSTLVGKVVRLEGMRKDGAVFPMDLSLGMWRGPDGLFFAGVIRERDRDQS